MDSDKVLGEDHLLTQEVRELAGIDGANEYKIFEVLYLETENRDFLDAGWINRIRWREKKKNDLIERTYKRRYPVSGELTAALAIAEKDGFTVGGEYEAQVDWGYREMTLSFSKTKEEELPKNSGGLAGMITGEAESYAAEYMPKEETGDELIRKAQKVGMLRFYRIKGMWQPDDAEETEITVEIWPIRALDAQEMAYITELSFKEEDGDVEAARAKREKLTALLDEAGILLHTDSMKTNQILDAYLCKRPETVSFALPASLKSIGIGAFAGTAAASVQIPGGTEKPEGDPFASGDESEDAELKTLLVIGTPGSGADKFATEYGYSFIPE